MKTIHTKTKSRTLIKKLYREILKDDSLFHFFYEPELVIRVSENHLLALKKYLKDKNINFIEYDYPKEKGKKGNLCFECEDLVLNNLDLFLQLYHCHSLAVLSFKKEELNDYFGRVIHTLFNIARKSYQTEGLELIAMGVGRIIELYFYALVKDFNHERFYQYFRNLKK